jgi:hypothetical protein
MRDSWQDYGIRIFLAVLGAHLVLAVLIVVLSILGIRSILPLLH